MTTQSSQIKRNWFLSLILLAIFHLAGNALFQVPAYTLFLQLDSEWQASLWHTGYLVPMGLWTFWGLADTYLIILGTTCIALILIYRNNKISLQTTALAATIIGFITAAMGTVLQMISFSLPSFPMA